MTWETGWLIDLWPADEAPQDIIADHETIAERQWRDELWGWDEWEDEECS